MFKIKEKYLKHIVEYSNTKLDLYGSYTKEEWNKAGFKDLVLEEVVDTYEVGNIVFAEIYSKLNQYFPEDMSGEEIADFYEMFMAEEGFIKDQIAKFMVMVVNRIPK
jgi:hypothetical protein